MNAEIIDTVRQTAVTHLVGYLPTLFATALILLAGWLVSMLLGGLAGRVMRRLKLDDKLRESGVGDPLSKAGIDRPASAVTARLVFWLVFLSFSVLALENLGLQLSELPIRSFVAYLPRVIGAVILLLVGILLAAILGGATDAGLAGMGVGAHRRLGRIVQWLLVALTVVVTVDQLGFDVRLVTDTFTSLVTIVVGGLALAFALGGREVARNALAGFYVKESFRAGELLAVDGHEGRLEEIGPLNARLSTAQGSVLVPNSRLIEQTVETRTAGTA